MSGDRDIYKQDLEKFFKDNYQEGIYKSLEKLIDINYDLASGLSTNITIVNVATYDLLITDHFLHVTYTATGAVTITLPTPPTIKKRRIVIKDAGGLAGTNNITIVTEGVGEKIDGEDTIIIDSNYSAISLYSKGGNWYIY